MRRMAAVAASVAALGTCFTGGASAAPAPTIHTNSVALSCPYGDSRTAADQQVQPGVVTYDAFGDAQTYTVDSGGNLQSIDTSAPFGAALDAVWQNGTDCSGSSISRNAWAVDVNGVVYGESDFSGPPANNYGDLGGIHLNRPVVGMSPTSTGQGYWLVASDGGIFDFGDASFYGSLGNVRLNKPIVGMAVTPDGRGYWLVATDGGIFQFGDAPFYGSLGNIKLNEPIIGMVATPDGGGYWLVASDGGVFDFGDATFHGSTGNRTLSAPIAGLVPNGSGYTLIGEDGQTYPFP